MRIKKQSAYNAIAYIAVICQALTWIGLPMKIGSMVSISVALMALITVAAVAFFFLDRKGAIYKTNDLVFLGGLVLLVTFCSATSATINVEWLKKMIVAFQLPVLILVAKRANVGKIRDVIYTVNACYPILFMYYYNSPFAHRFMGSYGERAIEEITLGFNNPNETAIYLMICVFMLLAAVFHYKSIFKRLLFGVELLFMLYLVYATACRAVILLVAAVLLTTLFFRRFAVTKGVIRAMFLVAVAVFLISFMFPNMGNIVIMGEVADTGRGAIINEYLEDLTVISFILGDFQEYPLNNMHNAFLSLLAAFGVLSACAYWGFYYRGFLSICGRKTESLEGRTLQLGCLAMVVHGAVEGALLTAGVIYAASAFLLLFMLESIEDHR